MLFLSVSFNIVKKKISDLWTICHTYSFPVSSTLELCFSMGFEFQKHWGKNFKIFMSYPNPFWNGLPPSNQSPSGTHLCWMSYHSMQQLRIYHIEPQVFSVRGTLQAWVPSRFSCTRLFETLWTVAPKLLCLWDSPGKNTRVGSMPSSRCSSRPRDQTHASCVSCIGKRVLYH